MATRPYDPDAYWRDLLGDAPTLRNVAYAHLPESFNRVLYRAMVAAVLEAMRRHGVEVAGRSVCDVGAGSGVWVDLWHRLGARRVAGVDITEAAVARLAERHPDDDFRQGDISAEAPPFDERFDVVSAMSVLLHVKDDTQFEQAVRNVAALLDPGGHLVAMDPILVRGWHGPPVTERSNSRARQLEQWRRVLAANDVEILGVLPVTALLANPADTRTRLGYTLLDKYWTALALALAGRERAGRVLGSALYAVDRPLRRVAGPSTKVLVARRA